MYGFSTSLNGISFDEVLKRLFHASVWAVRAEVPSPWSGSTPNSWFAATDARLDCGTPAHSPDTDLDAMEGSARSMGSGAVLMCPRMWQPHQVSTQL
jgi:hypothetical protein